MKVYKVKHVDGYIFWIAINPKDIDDDDEKVLEERDISEELLTDMTETDKDFIILEIAEMCQK